MRKLGWGMPRPGNWLEVAELTRRTHDLDRKDYLNTFCTCIARQEPGTNDLLPECILRNMTQLIFI